jgi:hypothetical protein
MRFVQSHLIQLNWHSAPFIYRDALKAQKWERARSGIAPGDSDQSWSETAVPYVKWTREGQDGKEHTVWISSHDPGYILYGIGRVKQSETDAADSQTNVDDIKQAAKEGRK